MPPRHAVGIDLGTTRVVVARVEKHGRSSVWRDPQGDLSIPAAVFFEDNEIVTGRGAKLVATTQPGRTAEFYKRDLGQAAYSRAIDGELLPPELVEACLLKPIFDDLDSELGGRPAAALSLPACFNQAQRRSRIDAAKIAGVEVLGTIHDPLAAALALAETQGYLVPNSDKPGQRVLVFDLGGGKLDVAVIEIKPGRLRTMAVGGSDQIGGRDWDVLLADYLADQFAKQFGDDPRYDMVSVRRLLASAEEAKHTLSARQQARVQVERGEDAAAIIVTRDAFEDLTADLVDRSMSITNATLARSGINWRDVSTVLLVGGGARMPVIAKRLRELTGLEMAAGVNPDEAVARGAALYAAGLVAGKQSPLHVEVVDITAHSLGLEWNDPQTGRQENVVVIARGSELPCGTIAKAVTDEEDQSTIRLQLLEGESRVADECARIAHLIISDLPAGLPAGTAIDVYYHFTTEGRLQVKAKMPRTGHALPISVRRDQGLGDSEIADWKNLLASGQGLKAIQFLLPKHGQQREAEQAESAPAPVSTPPPVRPPKLPASTPAGPSGLEEFALKTDAPASAIRTRNRGLTPRKLAIMIGGYVISALVGTAIGYYILMRIDPSYNWWNLRLPGLRPPPASSHWHQPPGIRTGALEADEASRGTLPGLSCPRPARHDHPHHGRDSA
ncbi:MAG: Hsp70 family protein [Planctomycetota bacterium]|mgnify:CR=1 FL=1|nr:MAG: Hsp70 family protein [Planctomycetota bacterium]